MSMMVEIVNMESLSRPAPAAAEFLTYVLVQEPERACIVKDGGDSIIENATLLSSAYSQTMSSAGGIMGTFKSSYRAGYYYDGIITHKILSIFFPDIEEMKRKTLEP